MKTLLFAFAALTLASVQSFAGYHYDYRSGNSYNTVGNTTFGNNANTGSSWTTTNTATGAYGTDSKGNTWNYNNTTGAYYNSNGTTCYGKGQYRTCN